MQCFGNKIGWNSAGGKKCSKSKNKNEWQGEKAEHHERFECARYLDYFFLFISVFGPFLCMGFLPPLPPLPPFPSNPGRAFGYNE